MVAGSIPVDLDLLKIADAIASAFFIAVSNYRPSIWYSDWILLQNRPNRKANDFCSLAYEIPLVTKGPDEEKVAI